MVAVHALVAEVLANLVDTLEAAHDEALEIELGGDAHVHVLVERIEMGDERTGTGTTGNRLQRGGLHLGVAGLVEHAAHGAYHRGTLQEGLLHTLVHHEVDIALAVAQFGVVELVVGHSVLVFYDGQGLEALRQQREALGMHADLARLGAEHESFDANEVANIEQALEDRVVEGLVVIGADVVTGDIHLDAALGVLQLCKTGLAHHAAAHHATGDDHITGLGVVVERCPDVGGESIGGEFGCGIRVDAQRAQLLQTLAPAYLLFAKF